MRSAAGTGAGKPPGAGRDGDGLEQKLCALVVRLSELARTGGQREVMRGIHRVVVVRALRQARRPVTIRDVAVRTGLPVYLVETALDALRGEGPATRDTSVRPWLFSAVDRPAEPPSGDAGEAASDPAAPEPGADAVSPAAELVAALAACGVSGQVNGHGVQVAVAGGPGVQVTGRSADGGWVWSWRHGGRQHGHPRDDAAGAAGKIAVCLAGGAAPKAQAGVRQ